jgi:hypothetical protein
MVSFIAGERVIRSPMISLTITITVPTTPRLPHARTGKPSPLSERPPSGMIDSARSNWGRRRFLSMNGMCPLNFRTCGR